MWTPCKTKKECKAKVVELLKTNDRAVIRGLQALLKRQTSTEVNSLITTDSNGVGFSAFDAEILTSFALFSKRTGFLTEKQMSIARARITKYAGQLAEIAGQREEQNVEPA